jgi:hypothetical protein
LEAVVLKEHSFSRAAKEKRKSWALALRDGFEGENHPSAAKAGTFVSSQSARLKPCPFKASDLPQVCLCHRSRLPTGGQP